MFGTFILAMVLMAFAGFIVAILMMLRDRLIKERRERMITQVSNEVTEYYLPKVKEIEVEMVGQIMDQFCDKLPDMMVKTMKQTSKMMEEL